MKYIRAGFSLMLCVLLVSLPAAAQKRALPEATGGNTFFRLATGGIGGNYYPLGGLMAQALSHPKKARPCESGGSCGVEGLVVYPLSANASLSNLQALETGMVEGAIVQSDAAYWAYTGTGMFGTPLQNMRFVASLYPENLHLVARRDARIGSVKDLAGHFVGVGLYGSGTLENVKAVLEGADMSLNQVVPQYLNFEESKKRLMSGAINAMFFVAATPSDHVKSLLNAKTRIVPIDGDLRDTLLNHHLYFGKTSIAGEVYGLKNDWETVGLGAHFLVHKSMPDKLIYNITRTLWAPHTQNMLGLHPMGQYVTKKSALFALSVPAHPGAARFYRENNMLKAHKTD